MIKKIIFCYLFIFAINPVFAQAPVYNFNQTNSAGKNGDTAAMLNFRLDEMQQIYSQLVGQIEVLNHKVMLLEKKVELLNKDMNIRFQEADKNKTANYSLPDNNVPPSPVAPSTPAPTPLSKPVMKTISSTPSIPHEPLSEIKDDTAKSPAPAPAFTPPQGVSGNPASNETVAAISNNPDELYNKAYDYLKRNDYVNAEKLFSDFIKKFPQNKFAGNAQYWLGETYYVRNDYEKAAIAFADGYKNYPDSNKSQDSLLKLGFAMKGLNKNKEACLAFKSFNEKFPNAKGALKTRANQEISNLRCSEIK